MSVVREVTSILAHRANVEGRDQAEENSLAACAAALAGGFGLELDLRRTLSGRFYISHDPVPLSEANALENFIPLLSGHSTGLIAINVKERIPEMELVELQKAGVFGPRSFFFDFELLEPEKPGRTQRAIRALAGGDLTSLAARISDRGESVEQCLGIEAEYVWADEFDSDWIERAQIVTLRRAGRRVIAVSPELHGRSKAARLRRWKQFREWGVDAICTDYCLEADYFFNGEEHGKFQS